jgi:hypothetical protein
MQLSLVVGILVAYLLGIPYEHNVDFISIGGWDVAWWRFVLFLGVCGSAIQVWNVLVALQAPEINRLVSLLVTHDLFFQCTPICCNSKRLL